MDLESLMTRERRELAPSGVFGRHHGVNDSMRTTLCRWLLEINDHMGVNGAPEAVQTAVALTDTYVLKRSVTMDTIQLVGYTAMMIALKLYGIGVYTLSEAVRLCNHAYTKKAFRKMEWEMLAMHGFAINLVIPLHFYYVAASSSSPVVDVVARMLMDVGAALISTNVDRPLPSEICRAALRIGARVDNTHRIDMYDEFEPLEIRIMAAMERVQYAPKSNGIQCNHPDGFAYFFSWYCDPEVSSKRKRHE